MTPDQVQRMINDSLLQQGVKDTYRLASVPFHLHNGADSPQLFQSSILTYIGYIGQSTNPDPIFILPDGWSVDFSFGAGAPRITHNLNTTLYVVSCTSTDPVFSSPPQAIFSVSPTKNYFDVYIFDSATQVVGFDTSFQFTVTTAANGKTVTPSYHGTKATK